jgi:hypothetical protein
MFMNIMKYVILPRERIQLEYFITHCSGRFPYQYQCNNIKQRPLPIPGTPTSTNPNLNFENYIVQYSGHSKPKREFWMSETEQYAVQHCETLYHCKQNGGMW